MQCPQCGAETGANEMFCGSCGFRLQATGTVPDPVEAARRKRRNIIIVVVVVAVLLLCCLCLAGITALYSWPGFWQG